MATKRKSDIQEGASSLKSIDVDSFTLHTPSIDIKNQGEAAFNMTNDTAFDANNNLIYTICRLQILSIEDPKQEFANANIRCTYQVSGLSKILEEEKDVLKNEKLKQIILGLTNISVSTSRGVLYGLLKGTYLHNALLPLVNTYALPLQKIEGSQNVTTPPANKD